MVPHREIRGQHIEVISLPISIQIQPRLEGIRLKPSRGKADRSLVNLAAVSGLREEKKEKC